jgi:hypothetical protein
MFFRDYIFQSHCFKELMCFYLDLNSNCDLTRQISTFLFHPCFFFKMNENFTATLLEVVNDGKYNIKRQKYPYNFNPTLSLCL